MTRKTRQKMVKIFAVIAVISLVLGLVAQSMLFLI